MNLFKTKSIYQQLFIGIVASIFAIEVVLLGFSYFAKERELKNIQAEIKANIERQHNIQLPNELMSKKRLDEYLDQFVVNVSLLTLVIIAFVSLITLVVFHLVVGRYLKILIEINNNPQGELANNLSPEDLPNNEIRALIESRCKMITELQEEKDNKLSELNEMLSSTPSCLKVITKEGKLVHMNSQGIELIEAKSLDSVLGADVYGIVEESHRDKFREFNHKVCNGHKGNLVFEIIGLGGTRRWMETYAAPISLPGGEKGHIAITNDITKRILYSKELEEQKKINAHTSKLASLGQLAAGVGHEINNPLAIAKGHLSILKRTVDADSLGKIDMALDRVASIVKGLKNFSRNDTSEIRSFNLSEMVVESVELMRGLLKKEEINIETKVEENLFVYGNRGRIEQVIINLLSNSRDAMEQLEHKTLELHVSSAENEQIHIRVKDSGHGIPEDIQSKIFDPFFTSKGVNEGTGIGLSLCHQIAMEHEGRILVESTNSSGTTFLFALPKAKHCELPEETEDNDLDYSSENKSFKILVAEDESELRKVLASFLSSLGHEVSEAADGKIAWELYQSDDRPFDIVITDIRMPHMDGFSLLENIRKLSGPGPLSCLVMTGGVTVDLDNSELAQNKLFDDYILKPFDLDLIELKLRQLSSIKKVA
jgi:PAS domain S-box-containing protein